MAAKHLSWYEYDRDRVVSCRCGWSGPCASAEDYFREVLDVTCPRCDTMLLVVPYPTHEVTRAAAAAGNEEAVRTLVQVEEREKFLADATASELEDPGQLPDLEADEIVIDWDFEEKNGSGDIRWTVLEHQGREIYREYAYWEGIHRFEKVLWILREKYGSRLAALKPTDSSRSYLLGDYLWASGKVEDLNKELNDYRQPVFDPESHVDVEDEVDDPDGRSALTKELHAALSRIVDIECATCGWKGGSTEVRVIDRGRFLDVGCARCRRPLFQVTPDQPE